MTQREIILTIRGLYREFLGNHIWIEEHVSKEIFRRLVQKGALPGRRQAVIVDGDGLMCGWCDSRQLVYCTVRSYDTVYLDGVIQVKGKMTTHDDEYLCCQECQAEFSIPDLRVKYHYTNATPRLIRSLRTRRKKREIKPKGARSWKI